MRPLEEVKREFTRQWLQKAEEDLAAAHYLLSGGTPFANAACFHAQQAAEKFLKAFLVWHQVEYPKTHDLDELLDLVARVDESLAGSLRNCTSLTDYAVDMWWPGDFPEASPADAVDAVKLAEEVREEIRHALREDIQNIEGSEDTVRLVTVFSATDQVALSAAKGLLTENGIECFELGQDLEAVFDHIAQVSSVRLQVRSADEEKAKEILADLERPDPPDQG